ncbi:MAG: hypothetical protein ABIR00_00810 [Nitrosospira sp.]
MALTDNCDLYGTVHEDGVNRIIRHIMRQRPSLFNYATADIANNRELWCSRIDFTPDVSKYGNSVFTIMPPLPLLGASAPPVGIGFCVQLTEAKIDFFPGNTIPLPEELSPPLKDQHFSLSFRFCAAIACPSQDEIDRIPFPTPAGTDTNPSFTHVPAQPDAPVVLHGQLECFCLDVFVIGHFERKLIAGHESLLGKVDDLDIVDIKPDRLEDNLVCFLKTNLNVVLRQKLTIAIETFMLSFPLFGLATVTLFPTPNPPVPHNPALEDDQLKVFVTMTVI